MWLNNKFEHNVPNGVVKMDSARTVITALALACFAAPLAANPPKMDDLKPPQAFSDLLDCRKIADPQIRLACYDSRTAIVAEATQKHDIVVTDRAEIRQTKRGMFGFAIPTSRLFGGGDDDKGDELNRLDSTVASARHSRDGGWIVSLALGGTWEQTDSKALALAPKVGQKVAVTKGALGSFFVSIDGQIPIKMHRIQ